MTDKEIYFYNLLTSFMARFPGWFLVDKSLSEFVLTGKINDPVHVGVVGMSEPGVVQTCRNFNLMPFKRRDDGAITIVLGNRTIFMHVDALQKKKLAPSMILASPAKVEELMLQRRMVSNNGFWKAPVSIEYPYYVQLPYCFGSVMDLWDRNWYRAPARRQRNAEGAFFDQERIARGVELLKKIYECAERAGIEDAMWLGFGCVLGYLRHGGFIPKDNDIDICISADQITKEQEEQYLEEIKKPFEIGNRRFPHGLCEKRFEAPSRKGKDGRVLWTSIGHRSIEHDNGVKACHWFFWNYNGIAWHSKGGRWINPKKFNQGKFQYTQKDDALCLGIPQNLVEDFTWVDFEGIKVRIPRMAGTCCDWWYPGWHEESGGSSEKRIVMAIGKWSNRKTWRIA